jgi:hypothetical protein
MAQFRLEPEVEKGSGLQAVRNWNQDLPAAEFNCVNPGSTPSSSCQQIYLQLK